MRIFWKKPEGKRFVQWGSAAIVLCSFLYPVLQSIPLAPLKSDATLNLYIAQQLAAGNAPYSNYFIMHPPVSHFLGALAVLLGGLFSIQAVIATRLLALLLAILIIGVTYFIVREILEGVELLAVWAVSSNVLMLMVVWGFYEKLVMVLFLYLAVLMIQKGKSVISGVFFGLVLMAWGGGIVLLPVFLIVFFFRHEISWRRFLLGVAFVLTLVFATLAISGSFVHFFQQYFVTVAEYAINKITFSGIRDANVGVSNITDNTNLSGIDWVVLLGGAASFFAYLIVKKSDDWFAKSTIAILAITLVYGLFILIDYQSPFDLIILFPALSILFAWGVWKLVEGWTKMWHVAFQPMYLFVFLLVFSLVRVTSFQRIPNRLFAQKEAAGRLQPFIEKNEVVFLGDLSPLVLLNGQNPSPAIQMGPKSFLAMNNQGYSLSAYIAGLNAHLPALILVDQRNMEYDYLPAFYSWLETNYVLIGDTYNPTINVFVNRQRDDAILPALAFVFSHNPGFYDHGELDLVDKGGMIGKIIPVDEHLFLIGYEVSNEMQLYWWNPPPTGTAGHIVYRLDTTTGDDLQPWTEVKQHWPANEISITKLPLPADANSVLRIEFCVTMGDVFVNSCEEDDGFSLLVSREN